MIEFTDQEEGALRAGAIGISIVVVGLVALNVSTGFSPGPLSITGGGVCVDGVSEVSYFSNSEELSGEHFIVSATGRCSDQVIKYGGEIPADKMTGTDNTGSTVQAEDSFVTKMTGWSAWAEKPINTDYDGTPEIEDSVYKVAVKSFDGTQVSDADQACTDWQNKGTDSPDELTFREMKSADDVGTHLYCFKGEKHAQIGEFKTGSTLDYTASFKVCSSGKCESGTQLSKQQLNNGVSIGSGSSQVYIRSDGLISGDVVDTGLGSVKAVPVCGGDCENPAEDVAWGLAHTDRLGDYKDSTSSFKSDARSIINYDDSDPKSHTEIMDRLRSYQSLQNGDAQYLLDYNLGQISDTIAGNSVWADDVRLVDGELRAYENNENVLARPELIFRIDADWVGVGAKVADPVVQQPPRISMNDDSSRTVSIDVDNNGPEGTVALAVDCQNTPVEGGGYSQTIPEGGTSTYGVTIDASKIENLEDTFTCAVNAKDIEAPSTQSSKTLTVDVDANFKDSDGDGEPDKYDQCPTDKGPESNDGCPLTEMQCSDGEDNDNDGLTDEEDPDCSNPPKDSDGDGFYDSESPVDQCPLEPAPASDDGCPPDDYPDDEVCEDTAEYPNGATSDNDRDGYKPDADPDCKEPPGLPDWILPAVLGVLILIGLVVALILYFDRDYPRNKGAARAVRGRVPTRRRRRGA